MLFKYFGFKISPIFFDALISFLFASLTDPETACAVKKSCASIAVKLFVARTAFSGPALRRKL